MGIIQYWKHYCVTNTDNISHPQKTQTCFTLSTKEVFHLIKILFFFFNRALFIIARTWKQSRCPSAEEWIRKFSTYTQWNIQFSSVTQSCLTVRPHGLQHTRPPCPLPTPRVYPNSCPLSQWCHPTISSSVVPFSSRSFPVNQFFISDQIRSVTQLCLTLCDPMNRSTPGLPVHRQLPEFTQTHVHRVSDAIHPPHLLLNPSPPAPNPSQHQSLYQSVNSLHEVAKVLEFQL